MKTKIYFLHILLFSSLQIFSQSVVQSVIAPGGGLNNTRDISLEWTIGEIAIEPVTSFDQLLTQGFHQTLLNVKTAPVIYIYPAALFAVSIFPNPVKDVLNVKVRATASDKLTMSISDIRGNILFTKTAIMKNDFQEIDMARFVPSTYILRITNAFGKLINQYKIIKIN